MQTPDQVPFEVSQCHRLEDLLAEAVHQSTRLLAALESAGHKLPAERHAINRRIEELRHV